jgi:hypothetical protein
MDVNVFSHLKERPQLMTVREQVLERILRSKEKDLTGDWRKLHNLELRTLYCSPYSSSVITFGKLR